MNREMSDSFKDSDGKISLIEIKSQLAELKQDLK
jgi:hypothetical protein